MDFLSLTQSNWFLVGPVAKVLGVVMNGIYEFLDMFGIASIDASAFHQAAEVYKA